MLDTSNYIRQAYLTLLNGNIIYNGKSIPVYGQIPSETVPDKYIVLGNLNEASDNNNHKFVTDTDIDIDIFCEQYRNKDLSVVDDISSIVLNLLMPTSALQNIGNATFQIFPKSRTASRYLPIDTGDFYVARKIITINNSIIQN